MTADARRSIIAYDWPGNARQLANVIERAVVLATGDTIDEAQLPAHVVAPPSADPTAAGTLGDVERQYVRRALVEAPTLREAAARLGIDRTSLWRMRKRWGLE